MPTALISTLKATDLHKIYGKREVVKGFRLMRKVARSLGCLALMVPVKPRPFR